jgi:hypothetical protein
MGMAKVTTWMMAMATRLAGDEEGKCNGGKIEFGSIG